ncbi:glucosaminidase domain-containing protein [Castellaniella caeni]|uniref:glucosaminidase domain-containing protein n=1 Tax=Castellaniella caeni TaxID=266123 RepID=UPI000C9F47BF|nr:glucosaminidase domain-containing protein [Castellaniella caeni]
MAGIEEFVQQYGPMAAGVAQKLKVDPSILLGQWGLETGWGKSVVPGSNNLGNIKDFSGGGTMATDNMTGSQDRYRTYADPSAFGDDYVSLIQRKYPQAVGLGTDAVKFGKALKFGGYAEDPAYIKKISDATSMVRGLGEKLFNFLIPAASAETLPGQPQAPHAVTGIDPTQVQWDDATPPAGAPLDPSNVKWEEPRSAVQTVGDTLMEIPRQIGLTARYGAEGLGQATGVVTEPIRHFVVNPVARLLGLPEAGSTEQLVSRGINAAGLPQPKNADERVVGDIARTMAGAGGVMGASKALANGATGVARTALNAFADAPGTQIASAAGAGGAGGSVRESGGGPGAQAVAALFGGLAAPAATASVANLARSVANRVTPAAQNVEQQVRLVMDRAGIDWQAVPARVRQMMVDEASKALNAGGDLSGDALRRLMDFGRVGGAIPTRGMLTLDPVQITREQNLAKTGANATEAGLQGLARVQNANNRALIGGLNDVGANTSMDSYGVGQRVIDALQGNIGRQKAEISRLYSVARDSQGRSFPLDGAAFTQAAGKALDDNLVGGFLPPQVRNHLNLIAQGKVPFTVDYAEQLKTTIGNLQRRATDGNMRYALGLVRRALDETPVQGLGEQTGAAGARAVNPENLPTIPGVPDLGEDAVAAFNQARGAHRSLMQQVEATPALKAVYEGTATPDQFMQKYILGSAATARDIQAMKSAIKADPSSGEAIRGHIAAWLKGKALNGAADEVGKFSASAYNKALQAIGGQKLAAFFTPDEIEQLKAIGRVGSYMTHQPVGSAVNNSNSGALVLGRGADFLNAISPVGRILNVGPAITGVIKGIQQSNAQRVAPALLRPSVATGQEWRTAPLSAALYTALFAPAAVPPRKDDRRP